MVGSPPKSVNESKAIISSPYYLGIYDVDLNLKDCLRDQWSGFMPVRRQREAGRPNIHWMRSRDSCAHNNQDGNSSFQSGRDEAAQC